MVKEVCGGKVNSSGICERCFKVAFSSSGYCIRLVDVTPDDNAITTKDLQDADEAEASKTIKR